MSAREPYDQERIVRRQETHQQPTESLRTTDVVHRERPVERDYVDDPHGYSDRVVYEDVAYRRPVAHYDYTDDAISEDVTIDHVLARRSLLDRISSGIWLVVGLLEVAIGLRVAFRLLEANETSGFVTFIYNLTEPFVRPFQGIFNDPVAGEAVLDTAALMAMVIWALAAWALVRVIWLLLDRSETGVRRSVREMHSDHI